MRGPCLLSIIDLQPRRLRRTAGSAHQPLPDGQAPVIDLIKELPDIQGCFLLTPTGTLGRYGPDRRFQPEPGLSQVLARPIGQFLAEYRNTQDTRWMRLGVVHADRRDKPWKTATLAFADDVLRRLYPVTASRDGRMTSFQLRQREHSVFRGLELLLDYRDPAIAEIPYYCPVLMYRGTTLAHYLPWPERPLRETDRNTVAVEVVDLLTGLARSQRNVPGAAELVIAERQALVRPERRQAPELALVEELPAGRGAGAAADVDPYAGEDGVQVLEELRSRFAASGFRDWDYGAWFRAHAPASSQQRFGAQLAAAGGYRYRAADDLRGFERFADLDRAALQLIAAKNPVFRVPPGTRLLDAGTRDAWNLYLLSGELELLAPDGSSARLAGASPGARRPVAFLKPRVCSVIAASEVEFLWLYEPMIEAVRRLHPARFGAPPAMH